MKSISFSPPQDPTLSPAVRSACYVEQPSAMEVMREQLEYLLQHDDSDCYRGCPECRRLDQVRRSLLRPFD